MAYTPTTWQNNAITAINATALNKLEQGLKTVGDTADAALAAGSGATGLPGVVLLESFAGANDDAKLTAALSYAAAQTLQPYIMFPARTVNLNQGGRVPFNGMKLVGPGFSPGPKNLELSSGKYVTHKVVLGSGITTGANSLFNGSGSLYDIYVSGLAFQGSNTQQFWDQQTGTLYACEFNSLTFYGLNAVFGKTNAKALMTQVFFTGHWTILGYTTSADTQVTIGGSDNEFWVGGYVNLGPGGSGTGSGRYQMCFDGVSKTNIGRIYCTCNNGWLGIRVAGNGLGLNFWGTTFEGYKPTNGSDGSTLRVEGGVVGFHGPWFAYGMMNPTANGITSGGMVHITGGDVYINRPTYERGTNVPEATPLVYMSAGTVYVYAAGVSTAWTSRPRVQRAGGTLTNDASVTVI